MNSKWVECELCGQTSCILDDGVECLRVYAPSTVCHGIMRTVPNKVLADRSIQKGAQHLIDASDVLEPYPFQSINERTLHMELEEIISRLIRLL